MKKTIFELTLILGIGASAFTSHPCIVFNNEMEHVYVGGSLSCGAFFFTCEEDFWSAVDA
jgi:hypothetical protein